MVMPTSDMLRIYFGEGHRDPHEVYANFMDISRTQAKTDFYTAMYTQPMWVGIIRHNNRIRQLVSDLAEELD